MQLLAPEAPCRGLPGAAADGTQPGPCSSPCAVPLGIHWWKWGAGMQGHGGLRSELGSCFQLSRGKVWSSKALWGSPTPCHPHGGHIQGWRFPCPWPGPAQQLLRESLMSFEAPKSQPAAVAGWALDLLVRGWSLEVQHSWCGDPQLLWTGVPAAVTISCVPTARHPCPDSVTSSSSVSHPWISVAGGHTAVPALLFLSRQESHGASSSACPSHRITKDRRNGSILVASTLLWGV